MPQTGVSTLLRSGGTKDLRWWAAAVTETAKLQVDIFLVSSSVMLLPCMLPERGIAAVWRGRLDSIFCLIQEAGNSVFYTWTGRRIGSNCWRTVSRLTQSVMMVQKWNHFRVGEHLFKSQSSSVKIHAAYSFLVNRCNILEMRLQSLSRVWTHETSFRLCAGCLPNSSSVFWHDCFQIDFKKFHEVWKSGSLTDLIWTTP